MDRQALSAIAHTDHPVAAPLGDRSVERVLRAAVRGPAARLLDLGCGAGAWLLHALRAYPGATAVGVDLSDHGFAGTREQAERLRVGERLELVQGDATAYVGESPADVVLAVGSSHAFGGLLPTLDAARGHLARGGAVVVGEGFWEREPDAAALAGLGATPDDFDDLASTVDRVVGHGWAPVYAHVSTAGEWDEYEWCWTGALERWALDHPGHPEAEQARAAAREHRAGWLHGYRGTLGFVVLVLRVESPP